MTGSEGTPCVLTTILTVLAMLPTAPVWAQSTPGRYEAWSWIGERPVGADPRGDRWIDVHVAGPVVSILEQPEGRVRTEVTWGSGGPTRMEVRVGGRLWTRSVITRDSAGRRVREEISGPGAPGRWVARYHHDAQGRVTRRCVDRPSREWDQLVLHECRDVSYGPSEVMERTSIDGVPVRLDRYDAWLRRLETRWLPSLREGQRLRPSTDPTPIALLYVRDAQGRLTALRRQVGAVIEHADPGRRPSGLGPGWLYRFHEASAQRWEIQALFGPPVSSRPDPQREERWLADDDYTPRGGCWLEQPSFFRYALDGSSMVTAPSCVE